MNMPLFVSESHVWFTYKTVGSSPTARQSPYRRRNKLHQIAGRITKVKGLSASWPIHFLFDNDAVALEEISPGVEIACFNSQSEVTWSACSMWRQLIAFLSRFWQECK